MSQSKSSSSNKTSNNENTAMTSGVRGLDGGSITSSSIIVEEWEDLGSSTSGSIRPPGTQGGGTASTLGSVDSEVINSVSSLSSTASGMSSSNATNTSPYNDELERLLLEAQREGSSRATSIRSSSGPHSPVWSVGGGTGFSSPVLLQNSANQTNLETALANYSSRPECTPLKPHELAEKFRHPNGHNSIVSGNVLMVSEIDPEQNNRLANCNYPLFISDSESEPEPEPNLGWLTSLSSSFRTIFSPPYSYFLIPTHVIMFGLGALCAYVYFAKRMLRKWR